MPRADSHAVLVSSRAEVPALSARVWPWLGSLTRSGFVVYLRSILGLILVWYLVSIAVGNRVILPPPWAVAQDLWRLLLNGEVFDAAGTSLWRLGLSFLLATAAGIPLGILMGLSRLANELIDPVVELLRPISGIAWLPLAMFIFGVGNELPIFIMTYVALFPILLNTLSGVSQTDPSLIRAARTMGVGRWVVIRHIVLPASLPSILVGLRIAGGACWSALVAAELVGAPSGLGFAIEWYRQLLMTPKVIAFIAVIALLGYLTDRGLRILQLRLTPWATGIGDVRA
jgi:ABC-type nitrate/sulfonate/bicarbonate transport system permease component